MVTCCLFHVVILQLNEWDCRGLSSVWAQPDQLTSQHPGEWGMGPVPAAFSILAPLLREHQRKEGSHSLYVWGDTAEKETEAQ